MDRVGAEKPLEPATGAVQTDREHRSRAAEHPGSLRHGQLLPGDQRQHLTIPVAQPGPRRPELRIVIVATVTGADELPLERFEGVELTAGLHAVPEYDVAGDAVEPREHLGR